VLARAANGFGWGACWESMTPQDQSCGGACAP
jgi:hypothetical protein